MSPRCHSHRRERSGITVEQEASSKLALTPRRLIKLQAITEADRASIALPYF